MAIKEVLLIGNPLLRQESSEVTDFNLELREILQDLKDTLTHLQETKKIGRGLAAPQIGHMKKIVLFQLPDRSFVMVNPKIVWKSEETFQVWDSCFCFDVAFFVQVERHKNIRIEYQDENGNAKTEEFSGDLSELVQHEVDHLYGILATDHLKDVTTIMMRAEWEKMMTQQKFAIF
jgi:peptide deformylase